MWGPAAGQNTAAVLADTASDAATRAAAAYGPPLRALHEDSGYIIPSVEGFAFRMAMPTQEYELFCSRLADAASHDCSDARLVHYMLYLLQFYRTKRTFSYSRRIRTFDGSDDALWAHGAPTASGWRLLAPGAPAPSPARDASTPGSRSTGTRASAAAAEPAQRESRPPSRSPPGSGGSSPRTASPLRTVRPRRFLASRTGAGMVHASYNPAAAQSAPLRRLPTSGRRGGGRAVEPRPDPPVRRVLAQSSLPQTPPAAHALTDG